jgi:hypothetical protein
MRRLSLCLMMVLAAGCKTPDTTAPFVRSTVPADGATDVVRNSAVLVSFNEAMDQASAVAAFSLAPAVPGSFTWPETWLMRFAPSSLLDSNAACTVTVSTGAQDLAGNTLAYPVEVNFTTGSAVSSGNVYMLGRSVLEAWFYHWGWTGDDAYPVARGRFEFHHRYVESPDETGTNMVASACQSVRELPSEENPVVFFKLCFADFSGGDSASAAENLERNRSIASAVADSVVSGYGYRLILGNALPVTRSQTDDWFYWNHSRYNAYLDSLAAARPSQVFVFDLYSVLTDPATHALKSAYASGPDDAHPNAAGYSALNPFFDSFLEVFF